LICTFAFENNKLLKTIYTLTVLFLAFFFHTFSQNQTPASAPLMGYVDMHTHPRSDLAFGKELFYGAPYDDIADALGSCKHEHGSNMIRTIVAAQTERMNNPEVSDNKIGYPNFTTWPSWGATLHQQMWVDWIERAHNGGLNIMVALAVNNHCLASVAKTHGACDDGQVLLDCIKGIKDLVAHSTFMEIALTPQDVRRIVADGKLAVILGSEMDNIGNFYSPADNYKATFTPNPTEAQIKAELDKIWELGIRYMFPVHMNNNVFGGSSLIIPALNITNKFITGAEFIPEQISTKESGISFHLKNPAEGLKPSAKLYMPLVLPKNVNPARKGNYSYWDTIPGFGHRNSLGITDKGRFGIKYMMQKGFIIDIDHMSEKMADEVFDMATKVDYPLNSGHSRVRGAAGDEGAHSVKQFVRIKNLGGMLGLQHVHNASTFVRLYRELIEIMDYKNVGIGTDANGFLALPAPNPALKVTYDENFKPCTTGNRTWDINVDGVAHYGLLPDYIKSMEVAGMTPKEKNVFMSSAESFTQMWEKCEQRKQQVAP